MKKHTRSILEELNEVGSQRNRDLLVEHRGVSLIESAVNLVKLIKETYSEDLALELEKRFFNAIRSGDKSKYIRGCRKLKENKKPIVEG